MKSKRNALRQLKNGRVPEPESDEYLTDDAIFEKKLGVIALHVLQCEHCKKIKLVELFARKGYGFTYCPKCHRLTGAFRSVTIEDEPTFYSEGKGLYSYHCLRCEYDFTKSFVIPKRSAHGSGGVFSSDSDYDDDNDRDSDYSSSSSSSSSGSFGGGSSGGGGYTGSW